MVKSDGRKEGGKRDLMKMMRWRSGPPAELQIPPKLSASDIVSAAAAFFPDFSTIFPFLTTHMPWRVSTAGSHTLPGV